MFGFPVTIFWIAFAALWIFDSSVLGSIFHWIQGIPLILEIIVWIVFLPWVFSLWILQTSLPLWLRIVIIVVIAFVTMGGSAGNRARKRSRAKRKFSS
jgi:hypothetical protein